MGIDESIATPDMTSKPFDKWACCTSYPSKENRVINAALPGEKIPVYAFYAEHAGKLTAKDIAWGKSVVNLLTLSYEP